MRMLAKKVVITGASGGIGAAFALRLAAEGADLMVNAYPQSEKHRLDILARQIERLDRHALTFVGDVANPGDMQAMATHVERAWGEIDGLVTCAGVLSVQRSEEIPPVVWQRVIDINLSGTFYAASALAPLMFKQNAGSMVFISSLLGCVGFPRRVAYAASKSGVLGVMRVLAVEWADRGIRVNAIAPGMIETPLIAEQLGRDSGRKERIEKRTPMGRLGTPADLEGLLLYLLSDESRFTTGQCLAVDGGWLANGYTIPDDPVQF